MHHRNILGLVFVAIGALGPQAGCVLVGYDFDSYRLETKNGDASTGDAAVAAPDGGCIARTCGELHAECGRVPDGCGGVLECGMCAVGVCGGGGPNRCGNLPCTAKTCRDLGLECGPASDGCGKVLDCGNPCRAPNTC